MALCLIKVMLAMLFRPRERIIHAKEHLPRSRAEVLELLRHPSAVRRGWTSGI